MSSKYLSYLCAGTAFALMLATPAIAAEHEEGVRTYSADLVMEIQNEYRQNSDDTSIDKTNDWHAHAEYDPTIPLTDTLYVDGLFMWDPLDQAAAVGAPGSMYFEREGAYVQELRLNYEQGPVRVWAGKFNPDFAQAWQWGRGIWSEDFAEDYQITEKNGVGGAYTFGNDKTGEHTLSFSTFMADRTFLSKALVTQRPRTKLDDGGASNTTGLSSYTLSLAGEKVCNVEGLSYIASARYFGEQSKNKSATTAAETGYSVEVNYVHPVSDKLSFDFMTEYAGFKNYDGVKDTDRDYYSASLVTKLYQNWNITLGSTLRDIKDSSGTNHDRLMQVTGGYDFGNGFTAEAGWRGSRESGLDTNALGTLIRYQKHF